MHFVHEVVHFVRAVAKRLVRGMSATAQSYRRAASQSECIAGRVLNFKITLNENGAVILESNLC